MIQQDPDHARRVAHKIAAACRSCWSDASPLEVAVWERSRPRRAGSESRLLDDELRSAHD